MGAFLRGGEGGCEPRGPHGYGCGVARSANLVWQRCMGRGRGAALRGVWMLVPGRDGLALHEGYLACIEVSWVTGGPRPGPAQQGRVVSMAVVQPFA